MGKGVQGCRMRMRVLSGRKVEMEVEHMVEGMQEARATRAGRCRRRFRGPHAGLSDAQLQLAACARFSAAVRPAQGSRGGLIPAGTSGMCRPGNPVQSLSEGG
jgi:hypothetical protein